MSSTPSPADFPAVTFERLWHVGTMDPADKGDRSYEGHGLSVSIHPEDWAYIARLGDATWLLTRTPAGALLDFHALSAEQRQAINAWGVDRGYVTQETVYAATWYDEELAREVSLVLPTRAEVEHEIEDCEYEREDGSPTEVVEQTAYVATATFPDHTVRQGEINPDEPLAALWVAAYRPDLDGVWFEDEYSPQTLSCPRGVLLPERVAAWHPTRES